MPLTCCFIDPASGTACDRAATRWLCAERWDLSSHSCDKHVDAVRGDGEIDGPIIDGERVERAAVALL